jgi:two-component system, NtrC family, sensor histidine kinase HydH
LVGCVVAYQPAPEISRLFQWEGILIGIFDRGHLPMQDPKLNPQNQDSEPDALLVSLELQKAESQAQLLARLAGGLAHEIKNPLSTMAINLALLQEEWERVSAAGEGGDPGLAIGRSLRRIRTLQNEVGRLDSILDEFLTFARGGRVNRKPEDLSRIVRELLEFVEPENESQGIRQHADLVLGLPLVLVDETQLKQAVLNLLVNARQAMEDGGELIVRTERIGNEVQLSITDTGCGMSESELAKCYEVFWSTKPRGTGLGLSSARRIVEEHGGRMTAVSEPGRGTSFSIVLPLAVELVPHSEDDGAHESALQTKKS